MKTYRKTNDTFSFAATRSRTIEEYTGEEPEPTPRKNALRVVPTTGETVGESIRPLAKARQVTSLPFAGALRRLA